MAEEEKSIQSYAAFCYGDDSTGTWLWAEIGKKVDTKKPFYADIENGAWQLKYDPVSRAGMVVATKQIITGLRLAGIGKVPKSWFEAVSEGNWGYNHIIEKFLRTGEYQDVEYFVHDRC